MPIVKPDYRGDTRILSVQVASDLLLHSFAYAAQCSATLDNVVAVALTRLLGDDKAEREEWLKAHPEALEARRLKSFPRGVQRWRAPKRKAGVPPASALHVAAGAGPAAAAKKA